MLLLVCWLVPAATLVGLMLFREHTSRNEDDFLRVKHPTASTLNNQAATADEMDVLDRWGPVLLSAVLVCGVRHRSVVSLPAMAGELETGFVTRQRRRS